VADVFASALGRDRGCGFLYDRVWTWRGFVTYYTVFVIDLGPRRVHMVGSTPHPDERFMHQVARTLTAADDGVLIGHHVLICDRDQKWTPSVRQFLDTSGIRVVQTPFQAPNANAYAERFARSIKDECLSRVILFGERHLRRTIAEFIEHYHRERNHQGVGNELIDPVFPRRGTGGVRGTPQLLLSGGVMGRDRRFDGSAH
jgi:putative transposase